MEDEEGLAEAAKSAEALDSLPGYDYLIVTEHVALRSPAVAASVGVAELVDEHAP
jgi:hypothetical protein